MSRVYMVELEHIIKIANPRELHSNMNVVYWETKTHFIIEYEKDSGVIYRAEMSKDEIRKTAPLESNGEHAMHVWEQHALRANRFIRVLGEYKPKYRFEGGCE